jgi:hypothetical protein
MKWPGKTNEIAVGAPKSVKGNQAVLPLAPSGVVDAQFTGVEKG